MGTNALKVVFPRGHERADGGIAWGGVLTFNGVAVLRFDNAGIGGCCSLDWKPHTDHSAARKALTALAPRALEPIETALGKLWDAAMLGEVA